VEEVKKPSAALSSSVVQGWNSSNVSPPIESPLYRQCHEQERMSTYRLIWKYQR